MDENRVVDANEVTENPIGEPEMTYDMPKKGGKGKLLTAGLGLAALVGYALYRKFGKKKTPNGCMDCWGDEEVEVDYCESDVVEDDATEVNPDTEETEK